MMAANPSDPTPTMGERHHPDRAVTLSRVGARAVMCKAYTDADAEEIHVEMAALWASSFGRDRTPAGMPEPLGCDGGVISMSVLDGSPLARRGDPGTTVERLEEIVELLADLHASGVVLRRRRHATKLVRSLRRKAERIHVDLRSPYQHAIDAMAAAPPADELLVPSHGDFSPRNVLNTPAGLTLIDFDRLQMAGRGRDLGYLAAWLWVTDLQNGIAPDWSVGDRCLDLYTNHSDDRVATERHLRSTAGFHRAAALLRIAESWSAMADRPADAHVVISEAIRLTRPGHVAP